jgi:hypothetical protein
MAIQDYPSESQRLWEVHALAIGKIALAWNAFQETLAELYANLFEESDYPLAVASWQSLVSDVAQQEMLRSAAHARYGASSREYSEINWILEKARQHLSNQRNFGIHTPFMVLHRMDKTIHVLPYDMTGNRRAIGLLEKDVLKEFYDYESDIRKMTSFAMGVIYNVSPFRIGPPQPWPERPQLQSPAPSLNPKK